MYGTILNNEQIHDTEPKLELDNSNVNSSSQSTISVNTPEGTISIDFNESNTIEMVKKNIKKKYKKSEYLDNELNKRQLYFGEKEYNDNNKKLSELKIE